jgi:hypothetical protein
LCQSGPWLTGFLGRIRVRNRLVRRSGDPSAAAERRAACYESGSEPPAPPLACPSGIQAASPCCRKHLRLKGILMFGRKKPGTVLSAVLTKTVTDAIKLTTKALVTATTGSTIAGEIAGVASKALLDVLSDQVSAAERKLDTLLRIDLVAGLRHLRDGLQEASGGAPSAVTDQIFHSAHDALTRAWAVVLDSREDAAFIRSLDAVALVNHSSLRNLAFSALAEVDRDLAILRERVDLLRHSEQRLREYSANFDGFLKQDEWTDKPWGYQEQRRYARWVRDGLPARQAALSEAENRLRAIEGVADMVRVLAGQSVPPELELAGATEITAPLGG